MMVKYPNASKSAIGSAFRIPNSEFCLAVSQDLTPILDGWPHDPDRFAVRIVAGEDGRDKIQVRLDLGILQMEIKNCEQILRSYKDKSTGTLILLSRRFHHIFSTTVIIDFHSPYFALKGCKMWQAGCISAYKK